jgi:hypothetical protein
MVFLHVGVGHCQGHMWATDDWIAADNSGHYRTILCPAHGAYSPPTAGRRGPLGS